MFDVFVYVCCSMESYGADAREYASMGVYVRVYIDVDGEMG